MDTELLLESIHDLLFPFIKQHFTRMQTLMNEIGLYRGQPPLLHQLWKRDGQTQSELAQTLNLQPATVTKMLQRMEAAGFIARRPDSQDQRVMRVFLTPAGEHIKAEVGLREAQVDREMLAGFSPAELALLADFLERMRDNLRQINHLNARNSLEIPKT